MKNNIVKSVEKGKTKYWCLVLEKYVDKKDIYYKSKDQINDFWIERYKLEKDVILVTSKEGNEYLEKEDEYENTQTNDHDPICPYCEHENEGWEIDNDEDEIECGYCGEYYDIEIEIERTFTSTKKKSYEEYLKGKR